MSRSESSLIMYIFLWVNSHNESQYRFLSMATEFRRSCHPIGRQPYSVDISLPHFRNGRRSKRTDRRTDGWSNSSFAFCQGVSLGKYAPAAFLWTSRRRGTVSRAQCYDGKRKLSEISDYVLRMSSTLPKVFVTN